MSIEKTKDRLGFHLLLNANFASDNADQITTVTYQFGTNVFPTEQEIVDTLHKLQSFARERMKDETLRLTVGRDFGFAGGSLDYKIKEVTK